MSVSIVFETHSWSEDNDRGVATGWLPGRLSARGRHLAAELGERRRGDVAAVFCSDLARAVETAQIAFAGTTVPLLLDWRLRECDYGDLNGQPREVVQAGSHLDVAFPGGESWRQAVRRVGGLLDDLPGRWSGRRVLIIGHVATRWALDHYLGGQTLEALAAADFGWREGWEYQLDPGCAVHSPRRLVPPAKISVRGEKVPVTGTFSPQTEILAAESRSTHDT